jgi:hypothetical protein
MSDQRPTDDWTAAEEFECSHCGSSLIEIKRCTEEIPGPYGPLLPAVFVCSDGHHVPVTTSPGYADAFERWHASLGSPEGSQPAK